MMVLLLLVLLCLTPVAAAHDFTATVVAVHDGDTITVRRAGKKLVKIRLSDIDAPELLQVWGKQAHDVLAATCLQQTATIAPHTKDRYGRTIAHVNCKGLDAGTEMIKQGAAWVYDAYAPKNSSLWPLQDQAKLAKVGLWSQPQPEPPWQWRKEHLKLE